MSKTRRRGGALPVIGLIAAVAVLILAVFSFYPGKYGETVQKYAGEYGLPESLVYAVIKTESGWNEKAVSPKGAKGLMQIMDQTGEWGFLELGIQAPFSPELLFEPEINIEIGCWYLKKLLNQFEDADTALAAYNAGSGNVSAWLKNPDYYDGETLHNIPFAETKMYVKRVNANKMFYEKIRGITG